MTGQPGALFRNLFEVEGRAAAGVGSVDKQPWPNPPGEPQTGTVDLRFRGSGRDNLFRRILTLAQWLPKPATSQFPEEGRSVAFPTPPQVSVPNQAVRFAKRGRELWSPLRRGRAMPRCRIALMSQLQPRSLWLRAKRCIDGFVWGQCPPDAPVGRLGGVFPVQPGAEIRGILPKRLAPACVSSGS
jgi:hypothetical protein